MENIIHQNGYLKLIIGPMFSGKSTELLREIRRYEAINKRVLVINHSLNKRYNTDSISTHDKSIFKKKGSSELLILNNLGELINEHNDKLENAEIICVEELQFFRDALEIIPKLVDDKKKNIICAGLIGDYLRESFGDILKLIPFADEVKHVKALCSDCNNGTLGIFTKRITNNTQKELIGTTDIYKVVCRHHYLQ
tara:strand:- start:9 stop:596 length:588 start_codon:yes stop_codon:yes gene_type:complete